MKKKVLTAKLKTPCLLRTGEMANRLGVSGDTLYVWLRKGLIPSPKYTAGGQCRWDPDAVLKAIERHQQSAAKKRK